MDSGGYIDPFGPVDHHARRAPLRATSPQSVGESSALRILITDGEQRSSLAAVRSLGRAGHHVVVCSTGPRPLAGASRYARAAFQVPDPTVDPPGFSGAVRDLLESEQIDVLLPMTDVSAPLLFELRTRMPNVAVPFPDREAYERLSDKVGLLDIAGSLGVPKPDSLLVTARPSEEDVWDEASEIVRFVSRVGLPVVLKPARSAVRTGSGTLRFGVKQIATIEALRTGLRETHPAAFPVMVQARVTGPGLGAFMLADRGRILAAFGHRRLREKPPTGGVSVYRESVALRDDVREHAARLLAHVGWTGVAMVEFKEDAATGTPYLMEVNGRFWGSLQLAVDAGVDFPKLLVDSVAGGVSIEGPPPVRAGIRSRWFWGDVDHLLAMLRMPRGYRVAHPELPSRLGALGRFLVPWKPGDRFEVLRLGDPRPFLRESLQWFQAL